MSRRIVVASLVLTVLMVVTATALVRISRVDSLLQSKYDNIAQLQSLPNESVHLQGVVTYADPFRKRFWILDEMGAVAIGSAPVGIEPGQVVRIMRGPLVPTIQRLRSQESGLRIFKFRREAPWQPARPRSIAPSSKN